MKNAQLRQLWSVALLGALTMLTGVLGCRPRLDSPEYGEIIEKIPEVKGADEPWPLPELDPPATVEP